MSRLKTIFEFHLASIGNMGGSTVNLIEAMRAYRSRLRNELIAVSIVVALAVAFAAFAITQIEDPDRITAYSGLLGVSVGATLELLRRLSRDWGRTTLLMAILENESEADIYATATKLIPHL